MAFDFDDMEAEAQARLAEGEDARFLLGVELPAEWKGGTLPPMRNIDAAHSLPARQDLPKFVLPLKMDVVETSNTRIRLFVFPGAGDSAAAWVQFVNQVAPWIDVAIFERPGHGQRTSEPLHMTLVDEAKEAFEAIESVLSQHAKGGAFEGAPFALLGHSMGCQMMVEVALLLKRNLGLEAVTLFAVDRGAPHLPLYSEEGYRMLCEEEPLEFFEGFNPVVHKLMQRPDRHENKDTQRMINMWKSDCRLSQEHLWPEGHHAFRCDLHVFRASRNFTMDEKAAQRALHGELKRIHELCCRITNSGPKSSAPWSPGSYEAWKQWTTEGCKVHDIDIDHIGVKLHAATVRIIEEVLESKVVF